MSAQVGGERHLDPAERAAAGERENGERQPRHADEREDAPPHPAGRRPDQARAQIHLVQRPAQHQRKIRRWQRARGLAIHLAAGAAM